MQRRSDPAATDISTSVGCQSDPPEADHSPYERCSGAEEILKNAGWPFSKLDVWAEQLETRDAMKKIGFLSLGHWSPSAGSQTRSAADALLQSIELAVAALNGAIRHLQEFGG